MGVLVGNHIRLVNISQVEELTFMLWRLDLVGSKIDEGIVSLVLHFLELCGNELGIVRPQRLTEDDLLGDKGEWLAFSVFFKRLLSLENKN